MRVRLAVSRATMRDVVERPRLRFHRKIGKPNVDSVTKVWQRTARRLHVGSGSVLSRPATHNFATCSTRTWAEPRCGRTGQRDADPFMSTVWLYATVVIGASGPSRVRSTRSPAVPRDSS